MTSLRNHFALLRPTRPASWLRHHLIVYSTCRKVQTQWPPYAIYHLGNMSGSGSGQRVWLPAVTCYLPATHLQHAAAAVILIDP